MKYFILKFLERYPLLKSVACFNWSLSYVYLSTYFLLIIWKLQDYVEYMGSAARVILMPSVRDANHDSVFPQVIFIVEWNKTLACSNSQAFHCDGTFIVSVNNTISVLFLQPAFDIHTPDLKRQVQQHFKDFGNSSFHLLISS